MTRRLVSHLCIKLLVAHFLCNFPHCLSQYNNICVWWLGCCNTGFLLLKGPNGQKGEQKSVMFPGCTEDVPWQHRRPVPSWAMFTSRLREVFLPLYSVLKYWVWSWGPQCKGNINILDRVQQRATDMMKVLEHIFYEERLGAGTVQPGEERAQGDLSSVYLMGGVKKTEPECAQWYTFVRTRDKGQNVKDKNFHLNRKKKKITMRVAYTGCGVEISKTQMSMILTNPL